jgi:hypothetical protein
VAHININMEMADIDQHLHHSLPRLFTIVLDLAELYKMVLGRTLCCAALSTSPTGQ